MGKPTFDICKFKTPELEGMESKRPHRALRDPGISEWGNPPSTFCIVVADFGLRLHYNWSDEGIRT